MSQRAYCSNTFCANLTSATVWRTTTCIKCGFIEFVNNLFDLEDCEICGADLATQGYTSSYQCLCGNCYLAHLHRVDLLNEACFCNYHKIESIDPAVSWLSRSLDFPANNQNEQQ
jgi:hypothetical protein